MTASTACLVVGAGPAGLAAAAQLERRGVDVLVLERGAGPATSWTTRYDRLRINTSSFTSHLPGRRIPLRYGRWPTRDELLRYYTRYAAAGGLEVRTGTAVTRIDPRGDDWVVATDAGPLVARAVVVATGKDRDPRVPAWPGLASFGGPVLHSADYRNATPFAGKRVLVVGAGSSAVDICLDLHDGGARAVFLSVRTPPHLVRRSTAGVPSDLLVLPLSRLPTPAFDRLVRLVRRLSIGDLERYGLALPSDGFTERVRRRGMIPTIDPGGFVPAVKNGNVKIVPALERLSPGRAVLDDGAELAVDALVACTGYDRGLEPLVGHLGVLDERGHPLTNGRDDLAQAPGLYFIGFSDVLTGNLRQIRLDSKAVAKAVRRRIDLSGKLSPWPPSKVAADVARSPRPIA